MLKIYNTLSRRKEIFKPLSRTVKMYSCGPTVYSFAHIGNLRAYVIMDAVRRVLRYDGFGLKGVMNITDVGHLLSDGDEGEDKMAKASREQRRSPAEIADGCTRAFMNDLTRLNIGSPEIVAKATDHIDDMISFVKALEEKGFAYETADGVYFDIGRFPDYGKLSRLDLEGQIAGARIDVNEEKRHPADFALWKKAPKEHIMQWPSPWGMGYPGWHIECSAMSKKYLGPVFDIHTGGVDHIPVHHENEIAQSEALEGHRTVNYWMHNEFMLVNGGKMSKSLGNTYTLSQLEDRGYDALAFRYFCLNTHYRKKLNFTFEGLDGAQTAYLRLTALADQHKRGGAITPSKKIAAYKEQFQAAVDDDINIPLAMGVLWTALREPLSEDIYLLALDFDRVLGLGLDKASSRPSNSADEPSPKVSALAEERLAARQNKNFNESDRLRDLIAAEGYLIIDKKEGYELKKK